MCLQVLEELAISLKHNLVSKLPFCAFNGGNDVFVDVGNKSLGLDALMRYLDAYPYEVRDGCAGYERWQRAWTSIGVLAACTCTAGSCLCIGGVCLSERVLLQFGRAAQQQHINPPAYCLHNQCLRRNCLSCVHAVL